MQLPVHFSGMLFRFAVILWSICLAASPTSPFGASILSAAQTGSDRAYAEVELLSERVTAIPGETIWFGASFSMQPGWHIYWRNAGDAGTPPEVRLDTDSDITAGMVGPFYWPLPDLLPIIPGEIMDYGYSGQIVLPFSVTLPAEAPSELRMSGQIQYLICKNICIPETADFAIPIRVGAAQEPDLANAEIIKAALATLPAPFEGDAHLTQQGDNWLLSVAGGGLDYWGQSARFFPFGHEIVHAADQPVRSGADGLQLRLTPADASMDIPLALSGVLRLGDAGVSLTARPGPVLPASGNDGISLFSVDLLGLLLLALIGGLILNFMPCVLPVISIKAFGFVRSAASGQTGEIRQHGIWYTAGVIASFGVLAAGIIIIRDATGLVSWGFWLQEPVFVTALILVMSVIGFWLLGLIELGQSLQNVGQDLTRESGRYGAFFTGFLAALVGAPCTGPFLGVALGAVLGQGAVVIAMTLTAMGLGMALPILLLSFSPGLYKYIPSPGPWMQALRQFFAFPMFLTAAWLLSVLGALADFRAVAYAVAGIILIAFGVWAFRIAAVSGRAILLSVLGLAFIGPIFGLFASASPGAAFVPVLLLLALALLFWAALRLPQWGAVRAAQALAIAVFISGVVWPFIALSSKADARIATSDASVLASETWSPQRVAELTAEGRAVFVDFTAEWCATCKANELVTLSSRAVTAAFADADVAFLVADYTRADPVIARALRQHGRAGVPMYLWYAAGAAEPVVLPEILSIGMITDLVGGSSS